MVNAAIKQRWVTLIRSAAAIEPACLCDPETGNKCYLGLLCELHRQETGNGHWDHGRYWAGDSSAVFHAPRPVMEWAEMTLNAYPIVGQYNLAELAESKRQGTREAIPQHTPAQVADLIEEWL